MQQQCETSLVLWRELTKGVNPGWFGREMGTVSVVPPGVLLSAHEQGTTSSFHKAWLLDRRGAEPTDPQKPAFNSLEHAQ